jgi:PST family polysaccharide transporter
MQVLAFMGILHSVYYFNDTVMAALGKQHWRLRLTLLNAVGNLIAFAIAVRWGIVAVALAYTIRGYLFSPLPLLALRRLIRLDLIAYLRQFAAPFAGCIAMALAVFATRLLWSDELSHGGQFIVHSIIGAVTYLAVAGWLGRTSISEVRVLIRSAREVPTTSAMQTSTSG